VKKITWAPSVRPGFQPIEPFSCWEIDEYWIAAKQPKSQYEFTSRLPWTLYERKWGAYVSFHAKREHCQIMADVLNEYGFNGLGTRPDSEGVGPLEAGADVRSAWREAKARIALFDAEAEVKNAQRAQARKENTINV